MIRTGEIRIWRPKYHQDGEVHEDVLHPWYESRVRVLAVQETAAGRICKVRPVHRPKVNDPNAFDFWADEYELKKI